VVRSRALVSVKMIRVEGKSKSCVVGGWKKWYLPGGGGGRVYSSEDRWEIIF